MNQRYCVFCGFWVSVESYSPDHESCWECIHKEQTKQQEGAN